MTEVTLGPCRLICGDCMDLMRETPDKAFDLAIVDPPYGNACNLKGGSSSSGTNGWSGMLKKAIIWNNEPEADYFTELFRVSQNQIIWGANHFISKIARDFSCFVIWDKGQRDFSLADGEMAWTSFESAARFFDYSRAEALQEGKVHPTQKPVALYSWLLANYAKPGMRILDTHLGSGSHAVACVRHGYDLTATEIDPDYFAGAVERVKRELSQPMLFSPTERHEQPALI